MGGVPFLSYLLGAQNSCEAPIICPKGCLSNLFHTSCSGRGGDFSCSFWQFGCFLQWWYPQSPPQNDHFLVGKPMNLLGGKPTVLGTPHFTVRWIAKTISTYISDLKCTEWSRMVFGSQILHDGFSHEPRSTLDRIFSMKYCLFHLVDFMVNVRKHTIRSGKIIIFHQPKCP